MTPHRHRLASGTKMSHKSFGSLSLGFHAADTLHKSLWLWLTIHLLLLAPCSRLLAATNMLDTCAIVSEFNSEESSRLISSMDHLPLHCYVSYSAGQNLCLLPNSHLLIPIKEFCVENKSIFCIWKEPKWFARGSIHSIVNRWISLHLSHLHREWLSWPIYCITLLLHIVR